MNILLHNRYEYNANSIYRAAIQKKWHVNRICKNDVKDLLASSIGPVRYYGNTLDVDIYGDVLPINFLEIDVNVLTQVPFTKRKIEIKKMSDSNHVKNKFIKPVKTKWFAAGVYENLVDIQTFSECLPEDLIYVQEVIDLVNEVRCFCLDGKILTSSFYKISREFCPIPYEDDVRNPILDAMVKELSRFYPKGIVLDFGYISSGEWCFIEPNEAWASGIYACDPSKCLDVIIESQETI